MEKVWNSCGGERQLGIWQSQIPAREAGAGELEGVAGAAMFWELCSVWRLHLLSAVWRQKQEIRQCCDPGLEIGPDSLVWSKRLL